MKKRKEKYNEKKGRKKFYQRKKRNENSEREREREREKSIFNKLSMKSNRDKIPDII